MDLPLDETVPVVEVVPVQDVRVETHLPTPPLLEIVFYAGALLTGLVLGAVATLVAHAG